MTRFALPGLALAALVMSLAGTAAAADKGVPARSAADRVLTPQQLRDCVAQKDRLHAQTEAALKSKAEVEAERVQAEQSGTALKAEAATLDRTSAEAVAAYNARVDARDKAIDAYEAKATAYNTQATEVQATKEAYDKTCVQRRYDERDLSNPPVKK